MKKAFLYALLLNFAVVSVTLSSHAQTSGTPAQVQVPFKMSTTHSSNSLTSIKERNKKEKSKTNKTHVKTEIKANPSDASSANVKKVKDLLASGKYENNPAMKQQLEKMLQELQNGVAIRKPQ